MANGLINLQTDLTSLKYVSMPLGSDKPLITKSIGQAPGSQIGAEISHRIDDTSRIAQMLISKPGLKYLLHEAELNQATNDRSIVKARKDGKSIAGAVLKQLKYTAQLVGSTLAQVPVNGTGTHFLKGFRTDTYLQPSNPGNVSAFASFFGAGGIEGAQYALRGEEVPGEHKTELLNRNASSFDYLGDVFIDRNEIPNPVQPIGTKERSTRLNAQTGAPIKVIPSGSIQKDTTVTSTTVDSLIKSRTNQNVDYDLGDNGNNQISSSYSDTTTNSYAKSTSKDNIGLALEGSELPTGGTIPTDLIQGQQISAAKQDKVDLKSSVEDTNTKVKKDTFRYGKTYTEEQADRKVDPNNSNTRNVIKEKRVGLGDQGKTSKATVPYWTPASSLEVDQVNMIDVGGRQNAAGNARDMAKFYFEIITPEGSKFLYFRAHIKSIDDSFNANWESRKYVGRAENFYTYGGFDRDVNVSFTIAAATRNEMRPLYRKMVYLASATAPTYGTSGLMRGTLARLTVGSYLDQIPGVITSVKFTVDNNVPWEIAMGQPEGVETDIQVLPMVLDCSVSFKPIHDFAPQTGLKHYFTNSSAGVKFF